MQCRIQDLRRKEVINICDGCRLGYVADVDIRVPEGQVVAIVEAMKLMNEIESDCSGKIVEILVENGQAVEYGQPLFRVEP